MDTKPIPFVPQQSSGLEELAGASQQAINVIIEASGAVRRRPGIRATSLAEASVIDPDGLSAVYVTEDGKIYAVSAANVSYRPIYRITPGGHVVLGGVDPAARLAGANRPIIVETEMILAIAGGGLIQKVEVATDFSDRLGGSPPLATHVVANNSRLLANDDVVDRTKIRYSDIAQGTVTYAGLEYWNGFLPGPGGTVPGFFTAEANPDPVVAIFENTNEVFVFGTRTLQVFAPDATLVFAPASTREYGCGAPYSVIKSDGSFFWLDQARRFVQSDGRSVTVISDPIQATLHDMTTVEDCFGYRVISGPIDCMVWTFPSDGRTFVFQKGGAWSQWQGYDDATTNWKQFSATSHAFAGSRNLVSTTDGVVGELSFNSSTDLVQDATGMLVEQRINASIQTGFINRGTDNKKQCKCIRLSLKRGTGTATPGPMALLKFRDRPGAWENVIPVDFGSSGDTEIVVPFYSLGVYQRREWCFEFAGTGDFVLASASEDFEVLEN